MRQITIIGTGLIGGSFALALRKHKFKGRIVGCDREPALEQAREIGAIDHGVADPIAAIRGSQWVVLATPVLVIADLIQRLAPALPADAIVIDVGSTKTLIVETAARAFGKDASLRFLAGHPMAGKESSGIANADADLFQNATWFVTPLPGQNLRAKKFSEMIGWIKKIGARVAEIPPDDHDRLCAWISHLPQMVSTALAATLVNEFGEQASLLQAGGRALREMTRVASSPYAMWRDIALSNRQNIADALMKLEQELAHIRENLNTRQLAEEFDRAHLLNALQKGTQASKRRPSKKRRARA